MKIKISYYGLFGVTSEDFKWWEAGLPPPPRLGPSAATSTFSLISLCLDLSLLNLP